MCARNNPQPQFIEALESRQFLSASALQAMAPAPPPLLAAINVNVRAATVGSALSGKYKGTLTDLSDGSRDSIRLDMRPGKKGTMTLTGTYPNSKPKLVITAKYIKSGTWYVAKFKNGMTRDGLIQLHLKGGRLTGSISGSDMFGGSFDYGIKAKK